MPSKLYYFHDPMCSWCWGYKPEWELLQKSLPNYVQVQKVLGGLAPDSDVIMPLQMQQTIASYWRKIETSLGAKFNYDFWTECQPKRSTYPACRAVIAARLQGQEDLMVRMIQEAYYLHAMNPSDRSVLLELGKQIAQKVDNKADWDSQKFELDLTSAETNAILGQEINAARNAPIQGFPSLVLEHDKQLHPIRLDYKDHKTSLAAIMQVMSMH